AKPLQMERAEHALIEEDLELQPPITAAHVMRFLRASLATTLAMKSTSIESVMEGLRARKARLRAQSPSVNLVAARVAVDAFVRLRPLLFGAQDACLYDSLALMRYLSYFRLFPTCVIGVQTGPFAAHCWVQEGGVVFNDAPEYVRRYTPIFAV